VLVYRKFWIIGLMKRWYHTYAGRIINFDTFICSKSIQVKEKSCGRSL